MEQVKVIHDEIEIVYIEGDNKWEFVLRGRTRRVDSLAMARDAINKVPAEKKTPFVRLDCFLIDNYSDDGRRIVTVTSYAGKSKWNGPEWWILNNGKREKVGQSCLVLNNDHNQALFSELDSIAKQVEVLGSKRGLLRLELKRLSADSEVDVSE